MIRLTLRRVGVVLLWMRFPLVGLAVIATAWYFGSADLRNLVLVVVGPFVAVIGLAVVVLLFVFGLPAPQAVRRPAPIRPLPAIRAHAEVAGRPIPLEAGDPR